MDILDFFKRASEEGVIAKDALSESKMEITRAIFAAADKKLAEAIANPDLTLKYKIKNFTLDPDVISSGRIIEKYNMEIIQRPVIDLVQQGGGMYGIALLGYTYIIEKVGIRFFSHGGTSAGAINASLLAAISNDIYESSSVFAKPDEVRQATKSELLTHLITNTDFSSFMGATGIIGPLQRILFKGFKSKILPLVFILIFLFLLISCFKTFGKIYSISNGLSGAEIRYFDFIIGSLDIFALAFLVYILLVKALGSSFGLNTGDEFYKWAGDLFDLVNVFNTQQLHTRLHETKIEPSMPDDDPRLVLISSNLTHNRIVKFPERAGDYWSSPEKVKPAAYLRASMSLPFIYRSFVPFREHYYKPNKDDHITLKARFVDGGMLSNFPIREFHRTSGIPPRFPTFGVLLSDIGLNKREEIRNIDGNNLPESTLLQYLKSFVKTFRNFYDYEFIFSNDEIKQRVVTVDTEKFNWLDFWMGDATKKNLFLAGVDAAIEQINKFQWQAYADLRNQSSQFKNSAE